MASRSYRLLTAAGIAALSLATGTATAQTCSPTKISFGWTQPPNVDIRNDNALRWPTDATMRVAYGGVWCPEELQVTLEKFEIVDGAETKVPVAAQVRLQTPHALVQNALEPLTVIEVDPIEVLEERGDYRLTIRPINPALPAYAEYSIEFRTKSAVSEPIPDFEGVLGVELDGSPCGQQGSLEPLEPDNPACIVSSKFRLNVLYQPLDRPELAYIIYRTSSTPLNEDGEEILAESDRTEIPVAIEPGGRDVLGTGLMVRKARIYTLYTPAPRRDCYAVRILDEWGRERGDLEASACIDLANPGPCPEGCEPGVDDPCQPLPDPNPFETNEPIPGQMCGNLGINGGPADRPVPPVGPDLEPDAGVTDGGDTDGGAAANDGGTQPDTGRGGGGDGGCTSTDSPAPWMLLFGLPLFIRRRR